MTDEFNPSYRANFEAMRDAFILLQRGVANIIRFDLVKRQVIAEDRSERTELYYHVMLDQSGNVLEEPIAFLLPLADAGKFLPYVSPAYLDVRTTVALPSWPQARFGASDDGLRMLAPDAARFPTLEAGLISERTINVSCMPADRDVISLDVPLVRHSRIEFVGPVHVRAEIDPTEAINLGRMLVWMGQRVVLRAERRRAGAFKAPDLKAYCAELTMGERDGLAPLDQVLAVLGLVASKRAHVVSLRPYTTDHRIYLAKIFVPDDAKTQLVNGDRYLRISRERALDLIEAGGPVVQPTHTLGGREHTVHAGLPGHYASARGHTAGPAATAEMAASLVSNWLRERGITGTEDRYSIELFEVK